LRATLSASIPGDETFQLLAQSTCPQVKK